MAAVGVAALAIFALANFQALEHSQQVSVVAQRVATLGESSVVEADPRLKIYETTPSIVADSPLLGTGAGNYSFAAKRYGVLDENDQPFDHAHDVPLTFAAELGIPGLLIFVWLAVSLARLVGRAIAGRRDFGAPALAVAAGLLGTVLTSMGDYPPRTNAIAATFLILVGALAALVRR
jgi:O-antigen ligase